MSTEMKRVYNLRKSNSQICFQFQQLTEESSRDSQQIDNNDELYRQNSSRQSSQNIHNDNKILKSKKKVDNQKTSQEIDSIHFDSMNQFTSVISKKDKKKQQKQMNKMNTCLVKSVESVEHINQEMNTQSTIISLPYFNFPVNISKLIEQVESNKSYSVFSAINQTHSTLYAISNKQNKVVTIAMKQNPTINSSQINECYAQMNASLSQKLYEFNDLTNDIERGNISIQFQKSFDQSTCAKDKQEQQQQNKKKNKVQCKYNLSSQTAEYVENNKSQNYMIFENVVYTEEEVNSNVSPALSNSNNKQLHIHISHSLITSIGWDVQQFVEQASFSGIPEFGSDKNYRNFVHTVLTSIMESYDHTSEKSVDTNDTSNFNQDKMNGTEITLLSNSASEMKFQTEITVGDHCTLFLTFQPIETEQNQLHQQKINTSNLKLINKKRNMTKTEIDYIALHYFKEESLGYDPTKVCKYRFISTN